MAKAAFRLSPLYFLGAVAFYGTVLILACMRWVILLRSLSINISIVLALRLTFIGLFFNNMMPSLTGGDIVKGYYVTRETSKKLEAVASILLDRLFGISGMFLLALLASIFALSDERLSHLGTIIIVFVSVFILGVVLFYNLPYWKRFSWVQFLWKRFHWVKGFKKFYDAIAILKRKRKAALIVFGLSVIIQGLLVLANYILARGLGMEDISLGQFFVIIPIAGFISALPISFAGWGIGEGAYRTFFMVLNPNYGATAVVLSVIYRLMGLSFSLVGLPFYLTYKHVKTSV